MFCHLRKATVNDFNLHLTKSNSWLCLRDANHRNGYGNSDADNHTHKIYNAISVFYGNFMAECAAFSIAVQLQEL